MPEPTVRATRYEVSCLPENFINAEAFALSVEYRGREKWAVLDGSHMCLSVDGGWDWESIPSEREDEWLAEHRFDLDTALQMAKEHAPKVVINGYTIPDVLAMVAAERRRPS